MKQRDLDLVVISDTHLGTYGCHAEELLNYLCSIQPKTLVLNGDFIDIWQFKKRFFPKPHIQIIHRVLKMAEEGTKVYYITGNHDDNLRRYADFSTGNIFLRNQLTIHLHHKKYWFFHGDVFDLSVQYAPMIAKIGGKSYDYLIRMNRLINEIRAQMGLPKMSLSKRIKDGVKQATKAVDDFEEKAIQLAMEKSYDYVVCGHIHQPQMRTIKREDGTVLTYLNSGDWVENLTALEYTQGEWQIYRYEEDYFDSQSYTSEMLLRDQDTTSLFEQMIKMAAKA
ncbi:MAG: UDP-2,3-diacylglucosamine diphosphatase [Bacteroidota bacterium]